MEENSGRPEKLPWWGEKAALRGFYRTKIVFLARTQAPRSYNCWLCKEDIPSGTGHAYVRFLFPRANGYDHYHVHTSCAEARMMPGMAELRRIPLSELPKERKPLKGPNLPSRERNKHLPIKRQKKRNT